MFYLLVFLFVWWFLVAHLLVRRRPRAPAHFTTVAVRMLVVQHHTDVTPVTVTETATTLEVQSETLMVPHRSMIEMGTSRVR
jgi:hypothetical protein